MKFKELDCVQLAEEVAHSGLRKGYLGTIAAVYHVPEAYEVEFVRLDGETQAFLTLRAMQLLPRNSKAVLHARAI
ncbi:MAG: DUF4926 domain-containing protein [Opitutales bacterium]